MVSIWEGFCSSNVKIARSVVAFVIIYANAFSQNIQHGKRSNVKPEYKVWRYMKMNVSEETRKAHCVCSTHSGGYGFRHAFVWTFLVLDTTGLSTMSTQHMIEKYFKLDKKKCSPTRISTSPICLH